MEFKGVKLELDGGDLLSLEKQPAYILSALEETFVLLQDSHISIMILHFAYSLSFALATGGMHNVYPRTTSYMTSKLPYGPVGSRRNADRCSERTRYERDTRVKKQNVKR